MSAIHSPAYASQPDIQIARDLTWVQPKWGSGSRTGVDGVFRADDERLYTFDSDKVTCPGCRRDPEAT